MKKLILLDEIVTHVCVLLIFLGIGAFYGYTYAMEHMSPEGPTCPQGWIIESLGQSDVEERPTGTLDRVILTMVCAEVRDD